MSTNLGYSLKVKTLSNVKLFEGLLYTHGSLEFPRYAVVESEQVGFTFFPTTKPNLMVKAAAGRSVNLVVVVALARSCNPGGGAGLGRSLLLKGGSELEVEHSASRVPIQFFLCCTAVVLYLAVLRVSAQDLEYYVL